MLAARHLRDLDLSVAPGFLAAASGLVRIDARLHAVADDALHLASFDLHTSAPGTLFRLVSGRLPQAHTARKAKKPDFEALTLLPPSPEHPYGALLALGSGSRPNRRRGVVVGLEANLEPASSSTIDLTPLYEPLGPHFSETNIEGALVAGERLLLFQRASAASPVNAMITYPLQAALAAIAGKSALIAPMITEVALPEINGAALSFTDATLLDNGPGNDPLIIFSAVAEASANAYDDGPLRAAAIGLLSLAGKVLRLEALSPVLKVEGIAVKRTQAGVRLFMVTDADDPATPAGLWSVILHWPETAASGA